MRDHELSSTRKHFCAGLGPRWIGPFKVVERYNTDVYGILRPPGDVVKVHVNDMRRSIITEVDESGNEIPELPPQQPPDLTHRSHRSERSSSKPEKRPSIYAGGGLASLGGRSISSRNEARLQSSWTLSVDPQVEARASYLAWREKDARDALERLL